MKEIIITAGAYIAALTGAGLASGAEICAYFVRYGRISIFGICLSAAVFAAAAYFILTGGSETYPQMCRALLGRRAARAANAVSLAFMLCVTVTMTSCSGEFFHEIFGLPRIYGALAAAALTWAALSLGGSGLTAVSGILGACVFAGMILVCRHVLLYRVQDTVSPIADNWVTSSLAYGGYNLLTAAPMLFACRRRIHTKRAAFAAAAAAGAAMAFMMAAIWVTIKIFYGKIPLGDIPMLTITSRQGGGLRAAYAVMLELAILTTAFGAGEGAAAELEGTFGRRAAVLLVSATAFALSGVPFGTLVDKAYRVFGFAAVLMLFPALKNFTKNLKKAKIKEKQQ